MARVVSHAKPEAPASLDGHTLPERLRSRLRALIDVLWDDDPLRSPDAILAQAILAFRQTAKVQRRRWVTLQYASLDGGVGPLVPIRQDF